MYLFNKDTRNKIFEEMVLTDYKDITFNTYFDYEKHEGAMHHDFIFKSNSQIFSVCHTAYEDLFQQVTSKDEEQLTIVVCHGMYINLLGYYTGIEVDKGSSGYNASHLFNLRNYKSKKSDLKLKIDADILHWYSKRLKRPIRGRNN